MIDNKKAILFLGAISAMNEIVKDAKKMGYYVIVTDYLENSPAKKYADETWMFSIDDVEGIVNKCKERGVDGVMNYCIDPGQKPYQQICEQLGLPCVAGFKQFDIMTNKDKFAKCCVEHGLDIIPKYNMEKKLTKEDYNNIEYPVMIKPVDGRASKGIIIAHSPEEMSSAIQYSLSFSKRKEVVVEKYMNCPEFCAKYVACDGNIYFTSMSDVWDSILPDGTRVYMGTSAYPSGFYKEYIATVNEKVIAMLKDIGIKNGALSFTGFYDNGKFRFFDPSLRMGGAQDWRIAEAASGVNIANLLTNFAITGSMGDNEEIKKIDHAFAKKFSALLYYDLKIGTIASIDGIDDVLKLPGIVGYHQCHKVGDTIDGYGTANNVAMRFIVSCDSFEEFSATVTKANQLIVITDCKGNDMIAPKYQPEYFRI
jgi:biotin carboxylase